MTPGGIDADGAQIAGEIKDFDPGTHIDKKSVRRLDKAIKYLLVAGKKVASPPPPSPPPPPLPALEPQASSWQRATQARGRLVLPSRRRRAPLCGQCSG